MLTLQLNPDPNRRNFLVVAGAIAGVGSTFKFTYDLLKTPNPIKEQADIEDLLPSIANTQVTPGRHHPNSPFHADVFDALISLTSLIPSVSDSSLHHFLPFDKLPELNTAEDMLLIGGPISNLFSRKLHGHTSGFDADGNEKISETPTNREGFRWHFFYPAKKEGDKPFCRFVGGQKKNTYTKAIVDTKAPQDIKIISSECSDDGFISTDYLLLTVQPNPSASSKTIIEIGDLQGQGDKTFKIVLTEDAARRELRHATHEWRYFQALYKVPVYHDHKKSLTKAGTPELRGVHQLL